MRLETITGKDDLRPIMQYVKVTAKEAVATNAHILGVIPSKNIFQPEFLEQLGENTILIHREDWKHIKPGVNVSWENEKLDMIRITTLKSNSRPIFIKPDKEEQIGNYPNWEAIVPKLDAVAISDIGINADLLLQLQKALNFTNVHLKFNGENRTINVTNGSKEILHKDTKNADNYGVIMPLMKN